MATHCEEAIRTKVILCFAFSPRASVAEVDAFKRRLIDHEAVVHAVESAGTYDLMLELRFPAAENLPLFLRSFAMSIATLVARHETSLVQDHRTSPTRSHHGCLWVPCSDGLRRIDFGDIDRIAAERDYVRIHCGPKSWPLKTTMAQLARRLDAAMFRPLHRSAIVRRDFIRNVDRREGRWEALLSDGSRQPISRSRLPETLRWLRPVGAAPNPQVMFAAGSSRLASP